MDWIELDSAILACVRYQPDQHLLQVRLRTGRDYNYLNVPANTYRQLLAAESKGRYYNLHIRNDFPFQRIESRSAG